MTCEMHEMGALIGYFRSPQETVVCFSLPIDFSAWERYCVWRSQGFLGIARCGMLTIRGILTVSLGLKWVRTVGLECCCRGS